MKKQYSGIEKQEKNGLPHSQEKDYPGYGEGALKSRVERPGGVFTAHQPPVGS